MSKNTNVNIKKTFCYLSNKSKFTGTSLCFIYSSKEFVFFRRFSQRCLKKIKNDVTLYSRTYWGGIPLSWQAYGVICMKNTGTLAIFSHFYFGKAWKEKTSYRLFFFTFPSKSYKWCETVRPRSSQYTSCFYFERLQHSE